jgi:hypothetical protein
MTSSHPTPAPCQWFARLAAVLDRRSAPRLALLFLGAILARGRRTVTGWIPGSSLPAESGQADKPPREDQDSPLMQSGMRGQDRGLSRAR